MPDYRSMFDRDYIAAFDLLGKDRTVTISKVVAGTLRNKSTSSKKPVIYFKGAEKGFAINKTNGKTIAAMYGNDTGKWIGKRITLFPTTTTFGSETMECIRVRPQIPKGEAAPEPEQSEPEQEIKSAAELLAEAGDRQPERQIVEGAT